MNVETNTNIQNNKVCAVLCIHHIDQLFLPGGKFSESRYKIRKCFVQ